MNDFIAESYRRHHKSVYRFVRRQAKNEQDAEDITQEVFEAATAALAEARLDAGPELAWLYTVAQRRLVRLWQRKPISAPFGEDIAEQPGIDERDPSYGARAVRAIRDGIAELPEGQRRVIVMKLFEGRRFAEIAAELDISEVACRMRLSRALAQLRECLTQRGVTP